MKKNCLFCNKKFVIKLSRSSKSKYCSNFCKYAFWKKHNLHFSKRTEFKKGKTNGEKNKNWKGGKNLRPDGYYHVYNPTHPYAINDRYILEHRLVMENWLKENDPQNKALIEINGKKYLDSSLMIHHKDHNKINNNIENLMIITRPQHQTLHHKGKKLSDESRKKMSLSKKGKYLSLETKQKISKSRREKYGKLNESQVKLIRKLYKIKQCTIAEISRKFNVSRKNIENIIYGKSWKDLL